MVQQYYDNTGSYVIAIILFFIFIILFVRELRNMNLSKPNIFNSIENENVVHVDTSENPYNNLINVIDEPETTAQHEKQVFNLSENVYTYNDAKLVCKSMGAELASLDNLVESYKKGADWCNVGWTKDGIAAFPVQMDTWKKTQENQGVRRNECGSYGINVARSDPHLLYGVNCYGVKPSPRGNEKIKHSYMSDKESEKLLKMDEFRKNINNIPIMPFNDKKWSNCANVV